MRGRRFLKQRYLWPILLALLALALGLSAGPGVEAVQGRVWQGEMIRLHVIARSDGEEDQRIKLAVRDALIGEFGARLEADTFAEASAAVQANLEAMRDVARETLLANGDPGEVALTFGPFDFPERVYGDVTVPAGTYQALRVVIGEGEGRNWWCVVYPSLCLIDPDCTATQQAAMPLPGAEPVGGEAPFKGALWEWIEALL